MSDSYSHVPNKKLRKLASKGDRTAADELDRRKHTPANSRAAEKGRKRG